MEVRAAGCVAEGGVMEVRATGCVAEGGVMEVRAAGCVAEGGVMGVRAAGFVAEGGITIQVESCKSRSKEKMVWKVVLTDKKEMSHSSVQVY